MVVVWVPFIIFYVIWLIKKRPYRRQLTYEFPQCKFSVSIERW